MAAAARGVSAAVSPVDDSGPSSGEEAARTTAEIADAFLAALRAGASQEQAGRQAAEASIDMIITTTAEQILAKTDAAVADQRARQARITQRWGTALDAYYMVTKEAAGLGALAAQPRPQATFDSVSKARSSCSRRGHARPRSRYRRCFRPGSPAGRSGGTGRCTSWQSSPPS